MINEIDLEKKDLDEKKKIYIKFLLGLLLYYEELEFKIKQSFTPTQNYELGFMINIEIVEKYKKLYNFEDLKLFLREEKIKTLVNIFKNSNSYKNKEELNKLLNKIEELLPEKYKNMSKKEKLFQELNNNIEIYSTKIKNYENKGFLYFINSILIDENLAKYLVDNNNEQIKNKIIQYKVLHLAIDNKLIIIYNFTINIGIIENNIFKPEIIISCTGEDSLLELENEIKINGYQYILKKINLIDNNIGKINKTMNNVLFLNEKLVISKRNDSLTQQNIINNEISGNNEINKKKEEHLLSNNPIIDIR